MKNERNINSVQASLTYAKEEVDSAEAHAKAIKDPELTKKLGDLKTSIVGVKDYLKGKSDPKKAG